MELKESDIQIQVIEYLKLLKGIVFFSVPNEAFAPKKGKLTGPQLARMARFKRMGLRAGVADIIIGHKGKMYCLELKTKKGRMSENQEAFKADCEKCGIPYAVARSFDEAIKQFKLWNIC